ncbi:MAG: sulfur carrier protein ThiS [Intestinibacillus sp.]
MKVNGETRTLDAPVTLLAYLLSEGYVPERVAVEQNGAIIPRSQFAEAMLSADDALEIVAFVGGG